MKYKISVVIAAFNEEKLLPQCLQSLNKQSYPKDHYEIILVDNGSTDSTASIGTKLGADVYSYTKIQACGASRKFGASKAKGSIIAFTDADCELPPDWLSKIEKAFADKSLVGVGGIALPKERNFFIDLIFDFYDLFHVINHKLNKPILWGFNLAVRASAYESVGGISEYLFSSEDWDLVLRLGKKFGSSSVKYDNTLYVYTYPRKQANVKVFARYAMSGIINYVLLVLLGRRKAISIFNVR